MTKIIGARIDQYSTFVRRDYGFGYDVTEHRVTVELHATKGWRVVAHRRRRSKVDRVQVSLHREALRARSSAFIPRGGLGARKTNAYGIQPLQVRP